MDGVSGARVIAGTGNAVVFRRSSADTGRQSRNVRFGLDFVGLIPNSELAQVFGSDAPGLPAVSSAGWRAQASR